MTTRRELIDAVVVRYRGAGRNQKKEILDEFVRVTGFHRKHAIRALKRSLKQEIPEPRQRARIYDEAVREALTIVWEAADRICGKRLRQVIVRLVDAMERHEHLKLDASVRGNLLSLSAATMDRLLTTVRDTAKQGRRRTMINTPLRKSIAVRVGDWHDLLRAFSKWTWWCIAESRPWVVSPQPGVDRHRFGLDGSHRDGRSRTNAGD